MKELISKIRREAESKNRFILAIDGRCASGKTSLAYEISKELDCNIIHADDFFLQPCQRTAKRYTEAGGNLDRERLINEVLRPLREKKEVSYRPFICHSMEFGELVFLPEKKITIVEGSYSCHPELREFYDMTVFVTVSKDVQRERILLRNGEDKLRIFEEKWIPLEERYFEASDIENIADIVIK